MFIVPLSPHSVVGKEVFFVLPSALVQEPLLPSGLRSPTPVVY